MIKWWWKRHDYCGGHQSIRRWCIGESFIGSEKKCVGICLMSVQVAHCGLHFPKLALSVGTWKHSWSEKRRHTTIRHRRCPEDAFKYSVPINKRSCYVVDMLKRAGLPTSKINISKSEPTDPDLRLLPLFSLSLSFSANLQHHTHISKEHLWFTMPPGQPNTTNHTLTCQSLPDRRLSCVATGGAMYCL